MLLTPAAALAFPPLAAAARAGAGPLDLDRLLAAPRIVAVQWTADGRDLVFESNATGRLNLWRVPAEGGTPERITFSDERTALGPTSPDGRWLVYTEDQRGNEKPNIYLLPAAGGPAVRLTDTTGVGYRGLEWSPDGRWLACAAERRAPGAYEAFRIDPDSAGVTRLAGNAPGECSGIRWSPDGRRLALTRTRDYSHHGVSVLDPAVGAERVLLPLTETTDARAMGWTRDGTRLFVASNDTPQGTEGVALVDAETGALTWLASDVWDVELFAVSPAADAYIAARNEAGTHTVSVRDLRRGPAAVPLPPGVLLDAEFSPDGARVALLHAAADDPADLYVYGIEDGTLARITRSLPSDLDANALVRPQRMTYRSWDGTPIAAFVYLPQGVRPDRRAPAIVYPHGGPAAQHTSGWYPLIQYLVSRGFAVIAPNYRGSTGFGRAFEQANMRDMGGGDLRDVIAAADALVSTGYADPRRMALMGRSYGGYLTLMGAARHSGRWAAGVAIVPFANWFTEYAHEDPILRASDRARMGDPERDADLWRDRSPIFFADRITAPLLILAGANDIRCPADEARQITAAVQRAGGTADLHVYEDEGHGFARRENEVDAYRRAAAFLEDRLAGPPPEARAEG